MRFNEEVTFKVGSHLATTDPSPILWRGDLNQHEVNLAATSSVCYDFNNSGTVDVGDIQIVAAAWGATDPASLDLYDFNENEAVDVGDLQIIADQWREASPC